MPIISTQIDVTSAATLVFAAASETDVQITQVAPFGSGIYLGDSGVTAGGGCRLVDTRRFLLHAGDEVYAAADTTGRVGILAIS
jgi:hypothetical protein